MSAPDEFRQLADEVRQLADELRAEADEAHRKLDEANRALDAADRALAQWERMYHRVSREHLATAIHLHKARAKLRDKRTGGTGVNITGVTITHLPPGGPETPPGFHALKLIGRDEMVRRLLR